MHVLSLVDTFKTEVSSIVVTSNIWSGNAKEDYLSVVVHFVNDLWELEKRIIGLCLVMPHSGDNIVVCIFDVLKDFFPS